MDAEIMPHNEEVTELLGKLVGRVEETSISFHVLVALLEEKGLLTPGELDNAVSLFLRERGRDYFVEEWGQDLGEGLYEGFALRELQ